MNEATPKQPTRVFFAGKFKNIEVAECELVGANLPITQEGAEKFERRMWKQSKEVSRHNKLRGCYGPRTVK